jgi:hypothetical protein
MRRSMDKKRLKNRKPRDGQDHLSWIMKLPRTFNVSFHFFFLRYTPLYIFYNIYFLTIPNML